MLDRQPQHAPPDASSGHSGQMAPQARVDAAVAGLVVPWGLRQTLWGIGLTVVPLGLLLVIAQLLPQQSSGAASAPLSPAADWASALSVFIASAIIESAFLIAPLYFAFRHRPAGTSRAAALRSLGLRRAAWWRAVGLVVAGAVVIYVFGLLYDLLGIKTNADSLAQQAAHAPITTIATLLVAITVAPFAEEVFFRGFVLPGLARAMPLWAAILLSALIFGVAHADIGSFLPLFVIGLVLAVVRWRSTSSWPGIVLHAANNGFATLIILLSVFHH